MTRTYGSYEWRAAGSVFDEMGRAMPAHWALDLEPGIRARARQVLSRANPTRTATILVSDTLESARDLEWLCDRWPLVPTSDTAACHLADRARAHRLQELAVGQILAGAAAPLDLPHEPTKPAREYQLAAVQMLRARRVQLLTDEVGLGKTFTALLNLTDPEALPAVVVPPTHLPRRWATELAEAFPWLTYEIARTGAPSPRLAAGQPADVTIVPYSKLRGWAAPLAPYARTVIFDEAQELRHGTKTEKGAAAAHLAEQATYVHALTATPVYNYGSEVFNIIDIIARGELGTRDEFLREWGGATHSNGQTSVRDPAALGSHLRESGIMLGRTRKDVGRQLPPTVKVAHTVDSDRTALAAVEQDVRRLAELILSADSTAAERFQASGDIDWRLRQATGIDKARYVAEFIRMLLESEERVIVWGWHRDVYSIWIDLLGDMHPALYTGSESPTQKAAAEDAFTAPYRGDGTDCRILIMSLRSGAGVDGLQKVCSVGVFGELDWSPQVHEQAIGRLRRDGMGEAPPVAYFLTSDSGSDPALMEVLQIKRQQAEPIISPDGKLLTNSTTDTNRARRLAEQILGITPTEGTPDE